MSTAQFFLAAPFVIIFLVVIVLIRHKPTYYDDFTPAEALRRIDNTEPETALIPSLAKATVIFLITGAVIGVCGGAAYLLIIINK